MKETIVIDDDYDDCRRFMVNAISKHTSAMSEEIDVPIICLDDDDDDDEDVIEIDKNYKFFLDHIFTDRYEADNGESEIRKFKTFSGDSKLENEENTTKKRVSQQRKRETVEVKPEISRAVPLTITREIIQRDNRAAERRKRRIAQLEAETAVPIVRNQETARRENIVRKFSELKAEASKVAPLVETEQAAQRVNEVSQVRKRKAEQLMADTLRKAEELKAEASKVAPLVKTKQATQRVNEVSQVRKRKAEELKADTLRKAEESKAEASKVASLVKTKQDTRVNEVSQVRKRKAEELKADTLGKAISLVKNEQDTQRDNRIAERRKRRIAEIKAVNETSRMSQVTQRNKGVFAVTRNKNEESVPVMDTSYRSYLAWLVNTHKDLAITPMANLHKDPSDLDTRIVDAPKESTTVPEKDPLLKVKVEVDLEPWSDDSDILVVSDTPFIDGEGTPFVSSKSMIIDLDEENTECESSCWFRKELMIELKRPYNEAEFLRLYQEASIHKRMTRTRELRNGRETIYETDELGLSYLEKFDDFNKVYKCVDRNDKAKALKLLRAFFFYLKNVSRDGAFKPWMDSRFLQEMCVVIKDGVQAAQVSQAANTRCIAVKTTLPVAVRKGAGPSMVRDNIGNVSIRDILTGGSGPISM